MFRRFFINCTICSLSDIIKEPDFNSLNFHVKWLFLHYVRKLSRWRVLTWFVVKTCTFEFSHTCGYILIFFLFCKYNISCKIQLFKYHTLPIFGCDGLTDLLLLKTRKWNKIHATTNFGTILERGKQMRCVLLYGDFCILRDEGEEFQNSVDSWNGGDGDQSTGSLWPL